MSIERESNVRIRAVFAQQDCSGTVCALAVRCTDDRGPGFCGASTVAQTFAETEFRSL